LIADGKLGNIRHFRGTYLQDWIFSRSPGPLVWWRLDKKIAGSGSIRRPERSPDRQRALS